MVEIDEAAELAVAVVGRVLGIQMKRQGSLVRSLDRREHHDLQRQIQAQRCE